MVFLPSYSTMGQILQKKNCGHNEPGFYRPDALHCQLTNSIKALKEIKVLMTTSENHSSTTVLFMNQVPTQRMNETLYMLMPLPTATRQLQNSNQLEKLRLQTKLNHTALRPEVPLLSPSSRFQQETHKLSPACCLSSTNFHCCQPRKMQAELEIRQQNIVESPCKQLKLLPADLHHRHCLFN